METDKALFTSEFVHDKKLQKEFLGASLHLSPLTKGLHLFLIGVLLWFFYEMILVLDAPAGYSSGMISLTALYLLIEGIRALLNRGGGIHYKRSVETNGGKPLHSRVQFFEDHILGTNLDNDNKNQISYDQIRAVFETKNLFLLSMKYRMFLIVDKRTLTGEREAFSAFLLERCTGIRKKKIRNIRSGQIINTIKWVVILILLLAAVVLHPALQLKERMLGQIHNGMEVPEILAELESFGITCEDPEMLEAMYGGTFFFYGSRLESLLHTIGMGEYDPDSFRRIPPENGVFFVYLWADAENTMYADLLEGIRCLDPENLKIEDIQETGWETGTVTVRFVLNGHAYECSAGCDAGRYDTGFLNELNGILQAETGNSLYFADYESFGYFLFFADDPWAERFSRRTGLELVQTLPPTY